jgi:hypothetical protein
MALCRKQNNSQLLITTVITQIDYYMCYCVNNEIDISWYLAYNRECVSKIVGIRGSKFQAAANF